MLAERLFRAGLVIVGDRLFQDIPITGLFDISGRCYYQPERIVVEIRTDVVVTALGKRLVLVICATCR